MTIGMRDGRVCGESDETRGKDERRNGDKVAIT